MTFASILTYVGDDEASDVRIRIACDLADRFQATLIGLAARAPRSPLIAADMIAREIDAEVKAIATELAAKERKFLAVASGPNRKVEWRASHKMPNDAVCEEARAADLIIIGRDADSADPLYSLEPASVLLRAGRPVVVVPPRSVQSLAANRILIAWQDSREARRAVRDSLPFLAKADEILLTQVCEQDESEAAKRSVHDVAKYLTRHRIGANAGIMLKAGIGVADELIRIAARENVDLIVVGAYGHSRLGEWVFGGVTRGLLDRSPVCCLFSH
jgi:nucleotide-binding universal stress UspA family protein